MKRLLIVLGSLVGIVVLVLLVAGYFIARFDPNTHKPEIEQAFHSATGRALHLDGNIDLTLFPSIGIGVDQVRVDNAEGFGTQPLLAVAHAQLSLALLPLLHSQVEIGTVHLSGVRINPQVAANGSNNWTFSTTNAGSAAAPIQNDTPVNKPGIAGIDINDAAVVYDNRQSKTHHEIINLNLQIREIELGTNSFAIPQFAFDFDESHISGNARVDNPAALQGRFAIEIDKINLDHYLSPADNTSTANPTDASKPLPLDPLRNVNLQGTLNIGQLAINGLKLSDIKIPLQAGRGVITLNPVSAALYGGSFSGNLSLDVAGTAPLAKVTATLNKIDIGQLVQDMLKTNYLDGNGTIEIALTGRGNNISSLKRNLDGTGKLLLADGVLRGVDIGGTLTALETMLRSKKLLDLPQGGQTKFNNFSATLAIASGVVSSNDLLIKAPGWQVTGSGTLADLRSDSLDFNLLATVDPATATVADQKYDIGGHKLPIACGGSLNSPRCLPDAKSILKDAVTKPARELLDKALNRLLR